MKKKADIETAIDATLDRFGSRGFFTHAYFECGFLSDDKPKFQTEWHKDQRSIFDLASLTKALVTAPLVFWQARERRLQLTDSVKTWLGPSNTNLPSWVLQLSIEELLQHKSGLPAWRNFYVNRLSEDASPQELKSNSHAWIESVFNRGSVAPLDKVDRYSDLGFILLGYVLEKSSGHNLDVLFGKFQKEVGFISDEPLGFFADFSHTDFVPTSYCEVRRRVLSGEVHDENAAALGGYAGHAGLFGGGRSLGSYLKNFYKNEFGRSVFLANAQAATEKKDSSLLGWRQANDAGFPFASQRGVGHYGFVGTAFWINPATNSYVIFLTNRVISGRVSSEMKSLRFEMFEAAESLSRS